MCIQLLVYMIQLLLYFVIINGIITFTIIFICIVNKRFWSCLFHLSNLSLKVGTLFIYLFLKLAYFAARK